MKLYKLHDTISKRHSLNVILKIEYFWHYWDFLFTENRDLILVYEPKFSSQISLIDKILKHLEWNNGINLKKLLKYFNHHQYFDKSNIILRSNKELANDIKGIKSFIENRIGSEVDNKYLSISDRGFLFEAFKKLKNDFFELNSNSNILIDKLLKIIFSNNLLGENSKKDLKFICNTIIDILIQKGYSLGFIKGLLSNTIFHPSNKFRFNYDKKYVDFNSYEDWKEYVSEQYELISVKDRFNLIKTFLIQPKRKGYYIFKVEGVELLTEPIEIFESIFYNPQEDKKLKFYRDKNSMIREEDYNFYTKCELFLRNDSDDDLVTNASSCNLIVPTEYYTEDIEYFNSYKFPTKSYIEAYNKTQFSLLEFKRDLKSFSVEYFFDEVLTNIRVLQECILVDVNYNYHKASNDKASSKVAFKLDDIRKNMLYEHLNFKSKIKLQSPFTFHLANSNALLAEYNLEYHKFNFKSFWIECIEPYFKDVDEFIDFSKKSIRLRAHFFSNYRILLNNALKKSVFSYDAYCLNDISMNEIGIGELNIGDSIIGDELEQNFELIPNKSLLDEFKSEMRLFKNDELTFLKILDDWITNTIKVAYDERNIEVHYNLVDYYNDISIKKDILFINSCVIGAFNDAVFENNVFTVIEAKEFINNTLNDLQEQ